MSAHKRFFIFENSHQLALSLMKKWVDIAFKAINQRQKFTAAISGGKTPAEFFIKLSSISDHTLWNNSHIFFSDERFVPFDHEGSNYKMAKDILFDYVPIPDENIHPMHTSGPNVELAANEYEQMLKEFFVISGNKVPSLDIMLLGIGEDGHVASLFPNDPGCNCEDHYVVPVSYENVSYQRISLTFPVINYSQNIIILAMGGRKSEILNKLLFQEGDIPAAKIAPENGFIDFYIDKDAAREIPYLELLENPSDSISVYLP